MSGQSGGNYNVIGPVTAEVFAFGENAQANKTVNGLRFEDFMPLVKELRGALDQLSLDPVARNVVNTEVDAIDRSLGKSRVDADEVGAHITGLSEKLKMVGVFAGSVATIAEPLKKIIDLVHIPGIAF